MNDIMSSPAFQEFLQKRFTEIENSEDNIMTGDAILKLEKELVKSAPDNIKNLYFQIDFLIHKRQENALNSLIKLR